MSQANVEIVKANIAARNAGDMDTVLESYDPEIIMRAPEGWPEPGPFVGKEAVRRQGERLREGWDTDTVELKGDLIDAGDRVVARMIWRGVGQGVESTMELTYVATLRQGKVALIEYFWDHAKALEALELSE